MINRNLVILKAKQPFVDWINEAEPYDKDNFKVTLNKVNDDTTCYLIPSHYGPEDSEKYVKTNWRIFFEEKLEEWYTEPLLWPKKITLKMFRDWFDVEIHSMVVDLVDEPLFDEEEDSLLSL